MSTFVTQPQSDFSLDTCVEKTLGGTVYVESARQPSANREQERFD